MYSTIRIGDTAQYNKFLPYIYASISSAWGKKLGALGLAFNVYYIGLQFS